MRARGEIVHGREALEESPVVRDHRGHARLLQHDFGDPHAVRVARRAPIQIALGLGEPAEQLRVECRQIGCGDDFVRARRGGASGRGHGAIVGPCRARGKRGRARREKASGLPHRSRAT